MPINMQIEYPKRVAEITTLTYEKEALQEENKVLKASNRQLVDALKRYITMYGELDTPLDQIAKNYYNVVKDVLKNNVP